IKADARIALVGDWGTGAGAAKRVLQQAAKLQPDILIHLGDIYYSGTLSECETNFLEIVNDTFRRQTSKLPVFTLSGNHDMYSGGEGYYALIDALNGGALQQKASFFCLRSEDDAWQLLALDTGLNDFSPLGIKDVITSLDSDEEEWHAARIKEFPGRTILLSHHPLFSAFSQIGQEENGQLRPFNPSLRMSYQRFCEAAREAGGTIAAWFWGHEHNLCIYQPYLDLERGRCVGHGAIPVFGREKPYEPLVNLSDPPLLVGGTRLTIEDDLYSNGFAILSLEPRQETARVDYYQVTRGAQSCVHSESLTSREPMSVSSAILFDPRSEDHKDKRKDDRRPTKFAFVVGNSAYVHVPPLTNPVADATIVRQRLSDLGFQVYGGTDFDLMAAREEFDKFEAVLDRAEGGVENVIFYYSGHGVQMGGQNYLIPIDADLASLQSPERSVQIQGLIERLLSKAKRCLVFLDACRDNPFIEPAAARVEQAAAQAKTVGRDAAASLAVFASRGLAPIDVAPDAEAFIAFAAAPGKAAFGDVKQEFSYFTRAFVTHVDTQGLDIDSLMQRIGSDVRTATNRQQDPWSQSNLRDDFFFKPMSWAPVMTMTVLGVLAGLLTAWFAFDHTNARLQKDYFGGCWFGLVFGYCVWQWGPQWSRLRGGAVAAAITALSWAGAIWYLDYLGMFSNRSSTVTGGIKFENWKVIRDIIGTMIAGGVFTGGIVVSGLITTPSL
ncbi:MAG: caspase family protein, partial [Acidobacteriales bacterium]|nr:caspase family protein [Terriglobales bacterium]